MRIEMNCKLLRLNSTVKLEEKFNRSNRIRKITDHFLRFQHSILSRNSHASVTIPASFTFYSCFSLAVTFKEFFEDLVYIRTDNHLVCLAFSWFEKLSSIKMSTQKLQWFGFYQSIALHCLLVFSCCLICKLFLAQFIQILYRIVLTHCLPQTEPFVSCFQHFIDFDQIDSWRRISK